MKAAKSPGKVTRPESPSAAQPIQLRLYVAGQTVKSLAAIANLRRICGEHSGVRYVIEVIDLIEFPQMARGDQILAIPTLVRTLPTPARKVIGDLSDIDRVLNSLGLSPQPRKDA